MKEMQFTTHISASKEKVWDTLWQDESSRQWAGFIDQETCMAGELRGGNEVQFISAENGYEYAGYKNVTACRGVGRW